VCLSWCLVQPGGMLGWASPTLHQGAKLP
jgi:hypothetical protein